MCRRRFLVESKSLKLYLAQFPQSRRLPRGLHRRHRQEAVRAAQAEMAAHRRLLVSARRHSDRRVLAGRQVAEGCLGARPGCRALSRARLNRRRVRPPQPMRAGEADADQHDSTEQQDRRNARWSTGPRRRPPARPPGQERKRTNAAPWPSRARPAPVRWHRSGSRRAAYRSRSRAARNWRTRPANGKRAAITVRQRPNAAPPNCIMRLSPSRGSSRDTNAP